MTVVVALRCADGVVMASDSQATEMLQSVRYDVEKLFPLTDHAVLGGTGQSQLIENVRATLADSRSSLETSGNLMNSVQGLVLPELQRFYGRVITDVPGYQNFSPATGFLIAGVNAAGPFIFEIDPQCIPQDHTNRGFHAVGSGAGFAQMANALLAHFAVTELGVAWGRLAAYRTLDAVIQTSSFGVGGEIQLWTVAADGTHKATSDEVSTVQGMVGGWQDTEREALLSFIEQDHGPSEPPEPLPEAHTEQGATEALS